MPRPGKCWLEGQSIGKAQLHLLAFDDVHKDLIEVLKEANQAVPEDSSQLQPT